MIVAKVFKRKGISSDTSAKMEAFKGNSTIGRQKPIVGSRKSDLRPLTSALLMEKFMGNN